MTMQRGIEICTNNEWLAIGGDRYQEEAGNEWYCEVAAAINRLFVDVTAIQAQGQRMLFHGWNGANSFLRKDSGLGTFAEFTDEEWAQACEIADSLRREIDERYSDLEFGEDLTGLCEAIAEGDDTTACILWRHLTRHHGLTASDPQLAPHAAAVAALCGGELCRDGSISFRS